MNDTQYKNTLIEYAGGGYSGCFWEFNWFYFGIDGAWHNLYTSGWKGVKTEQQARELLTPENIEDGHNRITIVNLDDHDASVQFFTAGNGSRMFGLAQMLENDHGVTVRATCENCGIEQDVIDMIPGDYAGEGGIVYTARNLYCDECAYSEEEEDIDNE